jgi:hypothetical protein
MYEKRKIKIRSVLVKILADLKDTTFLDVHFLKYSSFKLSVEITRLDKEGI